MMYLMSKYAMMYVLIEQLNYDISNWQLGCEKGS